jgi:psp operon transcriptional activator
LFLDEIGNAGLGVQEKVLRVIEYGELERLGGSDTITVSVRVVAATNLDLPAEARAGRFREDLLDRLSFDVLTLPPLRAREGDVRRLAEHFGRGMAADMDAKDFPGFSEAALDALEQYHWPGNVRELKNVAERATAYWPNASRPIDKIVFDPFASPYRPASKTFADEAGSHNERGGAGRDAPTAIPIIASELPSDFKAAVATFEKDLLTRALEESRHNQRVAARRLGLGYHQFRNALRKYDLLPSRTAQ